MPEITPAGIARVCHEANRALQHVTSDPAPSPAWDAAPDWQRDSAIEGVHHALNGATPEELHESWCEAKCRDGWTYGDVKDADEKTHPCLVAYDELPAEQQAKDALFEAIVGALAPVEPVDLAGRHPGVVDLMRWLTPNVTLVGMPAFIASVCHSLASNLVGHLDDGPELTAGLRKLLEAKDCFVRASL